MFLALEQKGQKDLLNTATGDSAMSLSTVALPDADLVRVSPVHKQRCCVSLVQEEHLRLCNG